MVGDRYARQRDQQQHRRRADRRSDAEASGVTVEVTSRRSSSSRPADGRRVNVTVLDAQRGPDLYAIGEDGAQDAVKPTSPLARTARSVYRYTAPDTVGTGGVAREGARAPGDQPAAARRSRPGGADDQGGAVACRHDHRRARLSAELQAPVHRQTVSRFPPNVMTWRALRGLGIEDAELNQSANGAERSGRDPIREQNPDGGWGWFSTWKAIRTSPPTPRWADRGARRRVRLRARRDRPGAELRLRRLCAPGIDTETWRLNRQAFYSYVLARRRTSAPIRCAPRPAAGNGSLGARLRC